MFFQIKIQKQLEKISELMSEMKDKLGRITNELHLNSKESQVKRINHDLEFSSMVNPLDRDDDVEGVTLAEEELSLKELYR